MQFLLIVQFVVFIENRFRFAATWIFFKYEFKQFWKKNIRVLIISFVSHLYSLSNATTTYYLHQEIAYNSLTLINRMFNMLRSCMRFKPAETKRATATEWQITLQLILKATSASFLNKKLYYSYIGRTTLLWCFLFLSSLMMAKEPI